MWFVLCPYKVSWKVSLLKSAQIWLYNHINWGTYKILDSGSFWPPLLCMFCFSSANKNNVLQNVSTDNKKVRQPANFYESRVTRSMLEHDLVFVIYIRVSVMQSYNRRSSESNIVWQNTRSSGYRNKVKNYESFYRRPKVQHTNAAFFNLVFSLLI